MINFHEEESAEFSFAPGLGDHQAYLLTPGRTVTQTQTLTLPELTYLPQASGKGTGTGTCTGMGAGTRTGTSVGWSSALRRHQPEAKSCPEPCRIRNLDLTPVCCCTALYALTLLRHVVNISYTALQLVSHHTTPLFDQFPHQL